MREMRCLNEAHGERWALYHADCCDLVPQLPADSIDFSVYSPPFVGLFVYSDSIADMGNCESDEEFFEHYSFLVRDLFRVTKPGRLSAVHCSDLPSKKCTDGVIGLKDFPGAIIRAHEEAGWIYHSRVTIWRSPVTEMTRTKALGLLYKQLRKDSTRSRQGLADTLLVFRKDGECSEPVGHEAKEFPVSRWQEWASPVWMDVDQTNTLNVRMARDSQDERHLCPLQLDVIERALVLWSNPGDVVLSPFAGVGSEGVGAIEHGRRFLGVELKESYFRQAARYLEVAERKASSPTLFDMMTAV